LRTNFLCKSKNVLKKSLSDWIYANLKKGKKINVFKNVLFSPLYVGTLCKYINLVVIKKINGTFNIGSYGGISKAKMSFLFARKLILNTSLLKSINYEKKN
jgi:dTDP-4-dehydrorhamnose reductase|tara:strand:+ start:636 stop:938 length:303 start_codon:yes stop_codon:yes gene_type:complete